MKIKEIFSTSTLENMYPSLKLVSRHGTNAAFLEIESIATTSPDDNSLPQTQTSNE